MQTLKLKSSYRMEYGKGPARKMREAGWVPGVLYGHGEDTVPISVKEKDLRKVLSAKWETSIVALDVEGEVAKQCEVIIKDIQQHPASGRILHIDLQHVRRGQKIRLDVPVTVLGDPRGVKEMGGILEHGVREVAIRCMPRHIPESIEIDVTPLGIHESIHVMDIQALYPDIEFLDDPKTTLANVLPPKVEVVATPAEEEAAEEEPEVIAKGKEEVESEGEEKTE